MEGSASPLLESVYPLVAVLLDVRYHPAVFSNVTDVSPVQSSNAHRPMLVTLSGMVTDVNPAQPEKA
mgnify:CR=1 FL=1